MLYNQGAGWGTHKEPGCQKHPVSHRVFLVDNVIVAKAMHNKVKYGRVSIFVISKTSQQIIPIKRAKNAELNQNFPEKHKSKKNALATVCAGLYCCLQAKKKRKKCQLIYVYAYSFNAGSAAILFRNASALVNGTFVRHPGSLKGVMYFFGLFFNLWPMCLQIILQNWLKSCELCSISS